MTSQELRKKFLDFFASHNHKIIPSASLVPSPEEQLGGKQEVLFTSAGMQPLIPYLLGKTHPQGKRLANVQKCLRTDDIDEVGDSVHHTFFEMLGNWSLGAYWKDEAIKLSFEFLTKELNIPLEKLAVSVFAGDKDAPRDEESAGVWKSLGTPEDRIFYFGKEHNWWPVGEKSGLCGPDTEMFYWVGSGKPEGKPNENQGWVEIWNDVFMQFNKKEDGSLEDLPQKNVDTGMGLERTLAVLNGLDDNYKSDLFWPIIETIEKVSGKKYDEYKKEFRIIADHIKAAVFLILAGVQPSNKLQGYILRRLLRRATVKAIQLDKQFDAPQFEAITDTVLNIYDQIQFKTEVEIEVGTEIMRFKNTLEKGLNEFKKHLPEMKQNIKKAGEIAFDLYQTYGFPFELTKELLEQEGLYVDLEGFMQSFIKHKNLSRTASAGMFKGGLADSSETVTKYHTATHLLHAALRQILGDSVQQKGSNITSERLRFDFSFDRKMTDEEIKKVEDLINEKIKEDLLVTKEIMGKEEALESKALGFFNEKYGNEVMVYTIGDPSTPFGRSGPPFSREICGGPHVEHTGVIGKIKITKEEAVSSGIRRIRAEIVIT